MTVQPTYISRKRCLLMNIQKLLPLSSAQQNILGFVAGKKKKVQVRRITGVESDTYLLPLKKKYSLLSVNQIMVSTPDATLITIRMVLILSTKIILILVYTSVKAPNEMKLKKKNLKKVQPAAW